MVSPAGATASRAYSRRAAPHRVAVLALDAVVGYDMAIPPQIFRTATGEHGEELYEVRVCGLDRRPIRVHAGYAIVPDHGREALADADTVIIPGTRVEGPRQHGTLPDEIAEALALIPPHARIMSICTGAFVLAAAGILDGRPATTHWAYADDFRRLYPKVLLDEDVLFVDDGDVLTSAGLGAGVDLCLHVVRTDHGSEVANRAARFCVVPPWRDGGQSQFIERHVPEAGTDGTAPTRHWALRHLDRPLDLAELARHARMSVRTFSRRFRAETGMSPGTWLIQQRVRHARHLLETTDLPVDRVAAESGLGTAASLRQHLRAAIGVSPLAYRKTFRPSARISRSSA
ncbi:MAG TPA: helix-turn-helix domain-containing protein [Actinophytocola sp.]|uniref:GlxA family transcriptional regulator n=1 Tax=Actinophytocola sp. TaxID=1872138 RepID=UPI002DDDA18C|nr:helix-turn-helix domain-containing protein [Actinophytocola sp.]HEV2780164.1 helix-turn-helix domain-containing protein [Actinophytocola sp.]